MNFNFSGQPEYSLNTSLIEETINLYGVLTKLLIVEKINVDENVFGDFSHLKTNNDDIHEMYMLPEISEDWDSGEFNMTGFGMSNFENIVLFVAKSNFDGILPVQKITGNLIIFPNNKIMEITDTDATTPGVNNLFTQSDAKSVYKLTCKPYFAKLSTELSPTDISYEAGDSYDTLDNYFEELVNIKTDQDEEAEITPQSTKVHKTDGDFDTKTEEAIVDKTEDDIWGKFK